MVAHDMLRLYRDEARRCASVLEEAGLIEAARLCAARADAFALAVKEIETDWEEAEVEDGEEEEVENEDAEDGAPEAEERPPRRRGRKSGEPTALWSAERIAALRALWPRADLTNEQILDALNALPGPPLQGSALKKKANSLPDPPRRPHWTQRPGREAERAALGQVGRQRAAIRARLFHSPERDALIRQLWPRPDVTVAEIARRVTALPPGSAVSESLVWRRAVALGLPSARFGVPVRQRRQNQEIAA
jgi:hypothetical protein